VGWTLWPSIRAKPGDGGLLKPGTAGEDWFVALFDKDLKAVEGKAEGPRGTEAAALGSRRWLP
jgi:hypothetical protein